MFFSAPEVCGQAPPPPPEASQHAVSAASRMLRNHEQLTVWVVWVSMELRTSGVFFFKKKGLRGSFWDYSLFLGGFLNLKQIQGPR